MITCIFVLRGLYFAIYIEITLFHRERADRMAGEGAGVFVEWGKGQTSRVEGGYY